MKKRIIGLFLCMLLVAMSVVGCGKKSDKKGADGNKENADNSVASAVKLDEALSINSNVFKEKKGLQVTLDGKVKGKMSAQGETAEVDGSGTVELSMNDTQQKLMVSYKYNVGGDNTEYTSTDYFDDKFAYYYDKDDDKWYKYADGSDEESEEFDLQELIDTIKSSGLVTDEMEFKKTALGYELEKTYTGTELVEEAFKVMEQGGVAAEEMPEMFEGMDVESLKALVEAYKDQLNAITITFKITLNNEKILSGLSLKVEIKETTINLGIASMTIEGVAEGVMTISLEEVRDLIPSEVVNGAEEETFPEYDDIWSDDEWLDDEFSYDDSDVEFDW